MHFASQYLAAAGISFVEKKSDDSHTNLGWLASEQQLETHPLSSNGDVLGLNYKTFSLEWTSPANKASLLLDGKTHQQVLTWLSSTSKTFLDKEYKYNFHYDLPYTIDDSYTYSLDAVALKKLAALRSLTQFSLEKTLKETGLDSDIRIWPHHFDSGVFASLTADKSVGFGLAIPDDMIKTHYFYLSAYKGHTGIDTNGFVPLSLGEWKNDGFKGAVLPAKNRSEEEVIQFFTQAINAYKN